MTTLTGKQLAYLNRITRQHGQNIISLSLNRLSLNKPIPELTKGEASRLIDELKTTGTDLSIDTEMIIAAVDLRTLASQHTILAGREGAKERYGPCPKCGGNKRFHVTVEWFFCRHCHPERGDCIEYLSWLEGLDFFTACEQLGKGHLHNNFREQVKPAAPVVYSLNPPGPIWQARAQAFIKYRTN